MDTLVRILLYFRNLFGHDIVSRVNRAPNAREMRNGVPQWYRVNEVERSTGQIDKYYSLRGSRFHSIQELKQWRENLTFDAYETDAVSF